MRVINQRQHSAGWIYDRYFARLLWRDFRKRRSMLAGTDRVSAQRAPSTLLAFDETVTAPLAGFDSADAYYYSASAVNVLTQITIPTVILAAADDPIVPIEIYDGIAFSKTTQIFVAAGGGHLGYYSEANRETPNRRWMDHRLVNWVQEMDRQRTPAPSVGE